MSISNILIKKQRQRPGLTLIEIAIAVAVISIAVLGLIGFRYYSILDAKTAQVQLRAAGIAQLFMETWKGKSDFDPLTEFAGDLNISATAGGVAEPSGFSKIATGSNYMITDENVVFYITASYKDETDRILNVIVAWPDKFTSGNVQLGTKSVELTSAIKIIP